jgi:hypothetical protein
VIANRIASPYRLNLIRDLREREYKSDRQRRMSVIIGMGCFGFFLLSVLYSGLTIWQMEGILAAEKYKVDFLGQEYEKYSESKLIVDKEDVELLNDLQGKGIFWTKKLAAIAKHLPENYWINKFSYRDNELQVFGSGYASPRQDQLMTLDSYMNSLRADSTFSGTFKKLHLVFADRREETAAGVRISFQFTAYTSKWKRK